MNYPNIQAQNEGQANGAAFGVESPAPTTEAVTKSSLLTANSQSYTEVPMQKFSHLWTIKNFNLIPVEMERLCSPWFSPPSSKDLWFLKLRLKAYDENNGNQEFIGVHLFLKESQEKKKEIRAHYTISVLDSMGNKRFTGECSKPEGRIFKAGTEGHGYKLLCPRDQIFRPENKLLGDENSLNIRCEVTVFGELRNIPPRMELESPFSEVDKQQYSMSKDYESFLKNGSSKDFVLISSDNERHDVHKSVLRARCQYFRALLDHDLKEKEENEVHFEDIASKELDNLIYFLYTDEVRNIKESASSLIVLADRFDLMKLKMMCEEHLIKSITVQSVGNILTIADMTSSKHLKEKCLEFTSLYPNEVASCPEFNNTVSKRPCLYKDAFEMLAKKTKKGV